MRNLDLFPFAFVAADSRAYGDARNWCWISHEISSSGLIERIMPEKFNFRHEENPIVRRRKIGDQFDPLPARYYSRPGLAAGGGGEQSPVSTIQDRRISA